MKTGMHTPACWEGPRFCICPGESIHTLTIHGVSLVPAEKALPGNRMFSTSFDDDGLHVHHTDAERNGALVAEGGWPDTTPRTPEAKPLPTAREMDLAEDYDLMVVEMKHWRRNSHIGFALAFGWMVAAVGQFAGWF